MQWQATRKTQSSTSWRPIINRTVKIFYFAKICNETKKRKKDLKRQLFSSDLS